MIEPADLRALIAIHDTGAVSRAAARLGYTPPNLTQRLRRLERRTGAPMVERVGRGVVLTEVAQALVAEGRPILQQLDDLSARTQRIGGLVRVAAFPTALRGLLIPTMRALKDERSTVEVQPQELEPAGAIQAVRDGRSDLAIIKTWGPRASPPEHSDLAHITLGLDPVDVLLPKDQAHTYAQGVSLSELTGQKWAVTPRDDPFRDWLAAHERLSDLRPAGYYEAAEIATLVEYVAAGLAVAAVAKLGRDPLPDTVVAVELCDPSAFRSLALVHRRSSRGPALTRVKDDLLQRGRSCLRAGLPQ